MRIDVTRIDAYNLRFTLRADRLRRDAPALGFVTVRRVIDAELKHPLCLHAVRTLRARFRRPRAPVWLVQLAYLDAPHRRRGYGTAFYAAVIRYVSSARGGIVARGACDGRSATSEAADRVWRSRTLAAEVAVADGLAAWGGR